MMKKIDYPAAHSMDTDWFAIDDAGEVALMNSGEICPVPINTRSQSSIFDLEDVLDKDEYGTLILPAHVDPFPDDASTAELDLVLAGLSEQTKAMLRQHAAPAGLTEVERKELEKAGVSRFVAAFVQLADPTDLQHLGANDFYRTFRMDRTLPIYRISCNLTHALCLRLKGKVLAWRTIGKPDYHDLFSLVHGHGIYLFEDDYGSHSPRIATNLCPPAEPPPRYKRTGVPATPRVGLPDEAMKATLRDTRYGLEFPFVHVLPGIKFAEVDSIQLADLTRCQTWGSGNQGPDSGDMVVYKNQVIVHQAPSAEREAQIATWRQAAEQGDMVAQYTLGYLFSEGTPQNYEKALFWYRKAAEQALSIPRESQDMFENGSAAQCCLADMLERGIGTSPDLAQAAYWYAKSAAQENRVAQYQLGLLYEKGSGVPIDEAMAQVWFAKSWSHRYPPAGEKCKNW